MLLLHTVYTMLAIVGLNPHSSALGLSHKPNWRSFNIFPSNSLNKQKGLLSVNNLVSTFCTGTRNLLQSVHFCFASALMNEAFLLTSYINGSSLYQSKYKIQHLVWMIQVLKKLNIYTLPAYFLIFTNRFEDYFVFCGHIYHHHLIPHK